MGSELKEKKQLQTETTVYCQKCGNKLLSDSVFCEICGTKAYHYVVEKSHNSGEDASLNVKFHEAPMKNSKWQTVLFAILGIVAVVFVSVSILIINEFNSNDEHKNDLWIDVPTSSYQVSFDGDDTSSFVIPSAQKPSSSNTTKRPTQSFNYTPECTCLSVGCDNNVSAFGNYCSEHKCAKIGCSYEKGFLSHYCSVHNCSETGCNNAKDGIGSYCIEHTCNESYCTSQKAFNSDYCSLHECSYGACHNRRSGYGFYCSEHTCAKSGCSNKKSVLSDYCLIHDN